MLSTSVHFCAITFYSASACEVRAGDGDARGHSACVAGLHIPSAVACRGGIIVGPMSSTFRQGPANSRFLAGWENCC